MIISIIISTFNRCELLPRLLNSLCKQTISAEHYEVIIIDDHSTDLTPNFCLEFCKNHKNFSYYRLPKNSGLSVAANSGISISKCKYLAFTDDDCIVDENWIEMMVTKLKNHPVVVGSINSKVDNHTKISRNIAEFHPFFKNEESKIIRGIVGANMGFQRQVFDEIGCFTPGCIVPDFDFLARLLAHRYTVRYFPEIKITHDPPHLPLIKIMRYEAKRSYFTIQIRQKYKEIFKPSLTLSSSILLLLLCIPISIGKSIQIVFRDRAMLEYYYCLPFIIILKLAWCWGASRGLRTMKMW